VTCDKEEYIETVSGPYIQHCKNGLEAEFAAEFSSEVSTGVGLVVLIHDKKDSYHPEDVIHNQCYLGVVPN
jgi:hypothetical protein